jgi:hypothetical protein
MVACFLMEKHYVPYIKWFGTKFSTLNSSKKVKPLLLKVLSSSNWKEREKYLCKAYEILAQMHNSLKITKVLPTQVMQFHDRPFMVSSGELYATEIKKQIKDPNIKKMKRNIGSINQFSESTDVLAGNTQQFKQIYLD